MMSPGGRPNGGSHGRADPGPRQRRRRWGRVVSRPTVGSLFAGVEGFGQGLEAAGFEVAWQVEIDKDAVSVLERHYPQVRRYRDVREVNGAELPRVDVLVGGFPCQDLSVAGARRGLAGSRSGLFFEVARIAAETATPWLLLENVPGLLSSFTPVESPPSDVPIGTEWTVEETSDLGVVLSTLAEHGYGFCTRTLDAQYVGVPQRRERVFIVGCLGDTGARAGSVLLEPESVLRDLASCLTSRQGAPGLPENGAGSGGVTEVGFTLRGNTNGTGSSDNAWNTTYVPVSVPLTGELSHGATAQGAANGLLIPESTTGAIAGGVTARYGASRGYERDAAGQATVALSQGSDSFDVVALALVDDSLASASSAILSVSGSSFPRRSARLRIPAAALGLK
jgi:hypothetical protein